MKHRITLIITALMLLASCTDDWQSDRWQDTDGHGIGFSIETVEQEEIIIGNASNSRRSAPATDDSSFEPTATAFEGNAGGLQVHCLPYPAIGQHSVKRVEVMRTGSDGIATTGDFHDSISVWGFTSSQTLMDELTLTRTNHWRSGVRWPFEDGGGTMRFYAIAPSTENIEGITVTAPNYSTAPTFTYIVDTDRSKHRDVLVASSGDISISSKTQKTDEQADAMDVPMTFQHVLASVRFAQGNLPTGWLITGIKLRGLKNSGTWNGSAWTGVSGNVEIPVIESSETAGVYTATVGAVHTSSTYSPGSNVFIDGGSLFMMPQNVSATLEVKIRVKTGTDGDGHATYEANERTITASLSGTWAAGYQYIYKITVGELNGDYQIIASSGSSAAFSTSSNKDGSFNVQSWRNFTDYSSNESGTPVTSHAVKWKVTGYCATEDGEYTSTMPTWLNRIDGATVKNGGYAIESCSFTANPNNSETPGYTAYNHSTILHNNASADTRPGYVANRGLNLSLYNSNGESYGTTKTANCYIVNRYGQYYFPLVYGNGLNLGPEFVDHKNREITKADIKTHIEAAESGNTIKSYWASLIWQDKDGLIVRDGDTYPRILTFDDKDYLVFNIGTANQITPGNAVIALYATIKRGEEEDVDELLWSWHIWVTDEVLPNDNQLEKTGWSSNSITVGSNVIPRVPLGWVPDDNDYRMYQERSSWVEITQVDDSGNPIEGGASAKFRIRQEKGYVAFNGTYTLYQWGRPNALPMVLKAGATGLKSETGGTTARSIYDKTGSSFSLIVKENTNAGFAIANPWNVIRQSNRMIWADNTSLLWGTTSKTIYDPCPPGYKVPAAAFFPSNITPTIYYGSNKGQYVQSNADDQIFYIPVTGRWSANPSENTDMSGQLDDHSTGFFWTNILSNKKTISMRVKPNSNPSEVVNNTIEDDYLTRSRAIWPVQE